MIFGFQIVKSCLLIQLKKYGNNTITEQCKELTAQEKDTSHENKTEKIQSQFFTELRGHKPKQTANKCYRESRTP